MTHDGMKRWQIWSRLRCGHQTGAIRLDVVYLLYIYMYRWVGSTDDRFSPTPKYDTTQQVLEEREREGQLLAQHETKRPDLLQRIQVRACILGVCACVPACDHVLSQTLQTHRNRNRHS